MQQVTTISPELGLRGVVFVANADAMGDAMARPSTELAIAPVKWAEESQLVRRRLRMKYPLPGHRVKGKRLPLNPHSDTVEVAADLVTRFFEHDPGQVSFIGDLAKSLEFIQVGVAGSIGGGIGVRLESIPSDHVGYIHEDRGAMTGTFVVSGDPMEACLQDPTTKAWGMYLLPRDCVPMWPGNQNAIGQRPLRHKHGRAWAGYSDRFIINALCEPR